MILLLLTIVLGCELHRAADLSPSEQKLVTEINLYRGAHDLPPLRVNKTLTSCARSRLGPREHQHPRFGWSWDHAHRLGFRGPVTDNLSFGLGNGMPPELAVHGWSTSDGHARQMRGYFKMNDVWENRHFDSIGVACSYDECIAVFGRDDSK